jgi:hypothetical protein
VGITSEQLALLREPFRESEIRYLPRVWCGNCRNAPGKCCQSHQKRQCRTCGQSLTPAHIDLKYVGHAEATNRLLNVDPTWNWEPVAVDANGLPQFDQNGGLWIRLTVCGVTRMGYGNAEGKRGGDAIKEIIGDAIRNAGMRFGMALDLWTSSDLEIINNGGPETQETPEEKPSHQPKRVQEQPTKSETPPREQEFSDEDWILKAEECDSADCAVMVYTAAQEDGVTQETLNAIKVIGRTLRGAEKQEATPPASRQTPSNGHIPGQWPTLTAANGRNDPS